MFHITSKLVFGIIINICSFPENQPLSLHLYKICMGWRVVSVAPIPYLLIYIGQEKINAVLL